MSIENKNMRIEDVVADRISKSSLGEFIQEDDLIPIAKKAIELAFFSDRVDRTSIYNPTKLPPFIVQMSQDIFKEEILKTIKTLIKEDDSFKENIVKAVENSIQRVTIEMILEAMFKQAVGASLYSIKQTITENVHNMFRNP